MASRIETVQGGRATGFRRRERPGDPPGAWVGRLGLEAGSIRETSRRDRSPGGRCGPAGPWLELGTPNEPVRDGGRVAQGSRLRGPRPCSDLAFLRWAGIAPGDGARTEAWVGRVSGTSAARRPRSRALRRGFQAPSSGYGRPRKGDRCAVRQPSLGETGRATDRVPPGLL